MADRVFDLVTEWSKCREAMLKAIEETDGTHTEDDVLVQIIAGKVNLWTKGESGIVTEFIQFPRMKVLNVFLVGGRFVEDIYPMMPDIIAYAKKNDCARIQGLATPDEEGRDRSGGWKQAFAGKVGGRFVYKDI